MTSDEPRRGRIPRIHATVQVGEDHVVQVLELASGVRATVECGRTFEQLPTGRARGTAPPEAVATTGERAGHDDVTVFDAGEQQWFRDTFCNGAQICLQGFDFAHAQTSHSVNGATGIAMVGREGPTNATLAVDVWECICVGPFCIGGHECFWVENWQGVVVPGHWLSVDTRTDDKYLRWRLDGAGGNTQVSLAARYG